MCCISRRYQGKFIPLRSVGPAVCLGVGVQAPPGIAQGLILGPNSARVSKTGAHTARTQSNKNLDMKVRTEAMEGKYET